MASLERGTRLPRRQLFLHVPDHLAGAQRGQRLAQNDRGELVRLTDDGVALGRELAPRDEERGSGACPPLRDAPVPAPGAPTASPASLGRRARASARSAARVSRVRISLSAAWARPSSSAA